MNTQCSTSNTVVYILISYDTSGNFLPVETFQGVMECSPPLGGSSTQSSSTWLKWQVYS